MFNSISWTDFLFAVGGVTAAYYVITVLLLYNQEIIARVKGQRRIISSTTSSPVSHNGTDNLLGAIKRSPPINSEPDDDHEVNDENDAIEFPDSLIEDALPIIEAVVEASPSDARMLLGRITDLLEEVKIIVSLYEGEKPSKEDLASTLRALLEKYRDLASTRFSHSINIFLYELCKDSCAEPLDPIDVQAWWPAILSNDKH